VLGPCSGRRDGVGESLLPTGPHHGFIMQRPAHPVPFHWEPNVFAAPLELFTVIAGYQLILPRFHDVNPRRALVEPLGYHAEVGPAVQVVPEEWPQVLVWEPLLGGIMPAALLLYM